MLSVLDVLPVGFCSSDVQGSFKRQNKSKSQISLKINVPLELYVCLSSQRSAHALFRIRHKITLLDLGKHQGFAEHNCFICQ